MKDAPLLKGSVLARLTALFAGLIVIGIAIVSMLESELGLPPWDVFHMGVSEHTPMSLGTTSIVVGLALIAVAWPAGAPPGFGTVANAIVIGLTINVLTELPVVDALSRAVLPVRIGLVVVGVVLFGVGSALYIGAGFGAGPRDSLMLVLARRTGWRIGAVRAGIEAVVLVAGLLLGGVAGIGTVALALLVGPSVELSFWVLLRARLALPGPYHAPEFGPLDVG